MSPIGRQGHDTPSVTFGPGAVDRWVDRLGEAGANRILLVARERYTHGIDALERRLGQAVAGRFVTPVSQVPGHVVDAAVQTANTLGVDWVVAHGGGSPIGVAKAIALECDVRIAAVPTTYAGSERTSIWGITRDGVKTTGRDPRVRPALVAYEPGLVTLDAVRSAQSLFNALAHSIEALYAVEATPHSVEAARASLGPIVDAIRLLSEDPAASEGRTLASYGAWKASEALDGASMALHHKLAHVLGGRLGMPHGPTHAALLPHTFGFNSSHAPAATAAARDTWGTLEPPQFLYDLQRRIGLPVALGDLGLDFASLGRAADGVLAKQYENPRTYDRDDLLALLESAWRGERPVS